jgi:L-lactate dehydrogenase complex protein LldG
MISDRSRATILRRIAEALGDEPTTELPEPLLDNTQAEDSDKLELARRFRSELERVGGEAHFIAREEDLPGAIAAFASKKGLGQALVDFAIADYALLQAQALLADTGSALVIERSSDRRLAPYLPRTCVIVADVSVLHAGLNGAALRPLFDAARGGDPGEALIITGPSRTADIEKTLVLGAHGPREVAVFIVGIEDARN